MFTKNLAGPAFNKCTIFVAGEDKYMHKKVQISEYRESWADTGSLDVIKKGRVVCVDNIVLVVRKVVRTSVQGKICLVV